MNADYSEAFRKLPFSHSHRETGFLAVLDWVYSLGRGIPV